ncbi:MAG: aminotransferase class I/II-fold pyridoxal phosphate-dependent enzyme, partial [Anaerolineae bacterium]|nr:aminotransferase class I/II-fold pyridoxal phosphate-dependent enzyme [Anaerolineae bacterium]
MDHTPQTWIDERNAHYRQRRDLLLEALPDLGLTASIVPQGALYLWARVAALDGDDVEYCRQVRETAYVSVVPGAIYGAAGRGFVRLGSP